MATLKIHGARFVLTVDEERRIIENGSILVEGQARENVGLPFPVHPLMLALVYWAVGMPSSHIMYLWHGRSPRVCGCRQHIALEHGGQD